MIDLEKLNPISEKEYPHSIKKRLQRNKAAINAPKQDGYSDGRPGKPSKPRAGHRI